VLILSHDVFNDRSGTVIAMAMMSLEPRAGCPLTLESRAELERDPRLTPPREILMNGIR
jgi:hypothetical protein